MQSKYYGYRSQYYNNQEIDFGSVDQRSCIIHPNIDSLTANSILNTYDLSAYASVNITQEMILDGFKNYYNKDKKVVVKPSMYWFHHFLRKCDNHILSMVTNENMGYSHIASKAIMEALFNYLRKQDPDYIDEENQKVTNGSASEELDKAAKSAINKAKKAIQDLQDTAANFGCGKSFGKTLEQAKILDDPSLLKKIKVNASELSKVVNHIIDKAVSNVGGKRYTVEESIFESDDLEDIANIENFAHVALLDDLSVKENRYILNFDLFIDDSGSMGTRVNLANKRVELRTIARMVAFQMYASKLVKDTWIFACKGELFKIPPEEIFTAKIDGGTNLSQCIRQSLKTGRPALLITDGNDYLEKDLKHNPKLYIVAIYMSHLSESFLEYGKRGQVLFYNPHLPTPFTKGKVKDNYVVC
tara:strand:+ start:676 stop:1923 length:1248 start_codon:yes stop_codon:yes gene_type:complete